MSELEILSVNSGAKERGFFDRSSSGSYSKVPVEKLKSSWAEVCEALDTVFSKTPSVKGYELEEVSISLAISVEGKFQLIAGGSVGGEATIQVKLTKPKK